MARRSTWVGALSSTLWSFAIIALSGRLATSVAKERELSSKLISELSTNISVFKNTPLHVTSKSDPYAHPNPSHLSQPY